MDKITRICLVPVKQKKLRIKWAFRVSVFDLFMRCGGDLSRRSNSFKTIVWLHLSVVLIFKEFQSGWRLLTCMRTKRLTCFNIYLIVV